KVKPQIVILSAMMSTWVEQASGKYMNGEDKFETIDLIKGDLIWDEEFQVWVDYGDDSPLIDGGVWEELKEFNEEQIAVSKPIYSTSRFPMIQHFRGQSLSQGTIVYMKSPLDGDKKIRPGLVLSRTEFNLTGNPCIVPYTTIVLGKQNWSLFTMEIRPVDAATEVYSVKGFIKTDVMMNISKEWKLYLMQAFF
ncbi:unnamed protein product, partial [Didymodactylos carnosus]